MAASDKQFAGSIPETYDRFLVPLIFESYASDLAERLARVEPREILETAAGTGVLTRAMASIRTCKLVATARLPSRGRAKKPSFARRSGRRRTPALRTLLTASKPLENRRNLPSARSSLRVPISLTDTRPALFARSSIA